MSSELQEHLDKLSRTLGDRRGREESRRTRKARREEEKRRRRREKRKRQRASASTSTGLVYLLAALVCFVMVLFQPHLWWLLFVAAGFGMGGVRQLQLVGERQRLGEDKAPAALPTPEEGTHEVDVLCDQLLEDLRRAPAAVRAFLQEPEAAVESLRTTCRALDARRRQLLAEDPQGQLEALAGQRAELRAKREETRDPAARARLDEALRSLEAQASALEGLKAAVERVDGEYTALLVLLQELRTRVAVARGAGGDAQLEGLRHSVQRLNTELDAITEALGAVQGEGLHPLSPIQSPAEPAAGAPPLHGGTRERS